MDYYGQWLASMYAPILEPAAIASVLETPLLTNGKAKYWYVPLLSLPVVIVLFTSRFKKYKSMIAASVATVISTPLKRKVRLIGRSRDFCKLKSIRFENHFLLFI